MRYQRGAVWWVKYYRNGHAMRESTGSSKESDAIRLLKIREGDIERGLPVNPKLNRIRFDEAAKDLKTEYAVNGRRSALTIRLHLTPHFRGRRLATITTADVNTFILKRRTDVIAFGDGENRHERKVSNGEINRELTTLKRIFNLARQNGKLTQVPHIPMLKERNVRTGFFEREQITRSSPTCRRRFGRPCSSRTSPDGGSRARCCRSSGGMSTSRPASSVWTLTQRRTTKAAPSPSLTRYSRLLEAQKAEHDRLKADGDLCPWVFQRTGKEMKGKRIIRFTKAWRKAWRKPAVPAASRMTCDERPFGTSCAPAFPSASRCR